MEKYTSASATIFVFPRKRRSKSKVDEWRTLLDGWDWAESEKLNRKKCFCPCDERQTNAKRKWFINLYLVRKKCKSFACTERSDNQSEIKQLKLSITFFFNFKKTQFGNLKRERKRRAVNTKWFGNQTEKISVITFFKQTNQSKKRTNESTSNDHKQTKAIEK